MQHRALALFIFECLMVALGAGGVRWAGPYYQWVWEVIFFLAIGTAVVTALVWAAIKMPILGQPAGADFPLLARDFPATLSGQRKPPLPLIESSIGKFARHDPLPRQLDETLAERFGLVEIGSTTNWAPHVRAAKALGIEIIPELRRILTERQQQILPMSLMIQSIANFSRGLSIELLFWILAAERLSPDKMVEELGMSDGWAKSIIEHHRQITRHSDD